MKQHIVTLTLIAFLLPLTSVAIEPPRVDYVKIPKQSHSSKATIWHDDFDETKTYHEPSTLSVSGDESLRGTSLESFYEKGKQGVGGLKLLVGDAPFGKPVQAGESFDEIYWRFYVKHQVGWQGGGPAKLTRGIIFTHSDWRQAAILHLWTGSDKTRLTLDPARGVSGGDVITTKYNDFANLKWLGNEPQSSFYFHSDAENGRWILVEVGWKLNTPGQADGWGKLWIEGELDSVREDLDFRGSYKERGINAIFLEAYWNNGSPVDQYRWIDEFVVSTKPIGPVTVTANPEVVPRLSSDASKWSVKVVDDSGDEVWRSKVQPASAKSVTVGKSLQSGKVYRFVVVQAGSDGAWSDFSPAHWPVVIE